MNLGKVLAKYMLRIVAVALVLALVFALSGCDNDKKESGDKSTQADTQKPDVPNEPDVPDVPSVPDTPSDTPTSPPVSTPGNTTGNNTKPTTPPQANSPQGDTKPAVTTYTVTFVNYDGTVIKTQTVEQGKGATAPAAPKREHFTFAGWDKAFDKVTGNLTVTATYTTTKAVIYAEHVSVNKGTGEVTMNIRVINNPAIMGAVLKVSVDDKVLGFKEATKTEYPGLTLTSPGPKTTASPYTFMLDALELAKEDKKDGTLFTITFKVKDTAATGKYDIKLSYDNGAIFDEDYKDPKVCLENGSITIK